MSVVIASHFGFDHLQTPNRFGFEIELENIVGNPAERLTALINEGVLHTEPDNSLRNNGSEFVTQPIDIGSVGVTYTEIKRAIKQSYPQLEATHRCGVHIHMNVRDLTLQQLARFMVLYSLAEEVIIAHTGERDTNNFCVPLYQSDRLSAWLSVFKKGDSYILDTINRSHKYAALNTKPITALGTVESRMLAGHLWDTTKPIELAVVLYRLKELCKHPESVTEFRNRIWDINTTSGYENILMQFFQGGLLGVDVANKANHEMVRKAVFMFKCANRG